MATRRHSGLESYRRAQCLTINHYAHEVRRKNRVTRRRRNICF